MVGSAERQRLNHLRRWLKMQASGLVPDPLKEKLRDGARGPAFLASLLADSEVHL